jgi:hypothetical protein
MKQPKIRCSAVGEGRDTGRGKVKDFFVVVERMMSTLMR